MDQGACLSAAGRDAAQRACLGGPKEPARATVPGPVAADASAARDAGRLAATPESCRAEARDSLLASDHDSRWEEAAQESAAQAWPFGPMRRASRERQQALQPRDAPRLVALLPWQQVAPLQVPPAVQ